MVQSIVNFCRVLLCACFTLHFQQHLVLILLLHLRKLRLTSTSSRYLIGLFVSPVRSSIKTAYNNNNKRTTFSYILTIVELLRNHPRPPHTVHTSPLIFNYNIKTV